MKELKVDVPKVDDVMERERKKLYSDKVAKTPKEVVDNLL